MIISLLNQKGGVGKTTLAVNLADCLHLQNKRVLLIDSDPQSSALDWSSTRTYDDGFSVIGIPKATVHKEVKNFEKDYEYIIIDSPPRSYDVLRSILLASNIVLMPVQPSPYDVWATDEIIKLINECKNFNENMKSAFVINRKITNTAIGRDVISAFDDIDIPVLQASITQRVIFAETVGTGSSVCRKEPNGIAAQEINSVIEEIQSLGN
jgi:chromosome partitioning protein